MSKTLNLTEAALAEMSPEKLLKEFATFKHIQLLGECLGYNPQITTQGTQLPLKDWNYDDLDEDCQKGLDRWTTSKQAAPEISRQLLNAGTAVLCTQVTYAALLGEVADHLKLGKFLGKTLNDLEQAITLHLLETSLKRLSSLSDSDRAKFNEDLMEFLKERGVELGTKSPVDYLKAGGLAGGGALAGTQIATGLILSHLGVVNSFLFALGLWAVPIWLGPVIFAPFLAGSLIYMLGRHNFKKTIPCVAIIASIRQEALIKHAQQPVV